MRIVTARTSLREEEVIGLLIISLLGAGLAQGWGWTLFSGLVTVLLGIMLWSEFPISGASATGMLVWIRMLLSGLTLIMVGSAMRGVVKKEEKCGMIRSHYRSQEHHKNIFTRLR